MTKEELKTKALDYIKKSKSAMESDQLQNAEKMKRYLCDPYGNEVDGRSKVVMSDVSDTIEWIMPSLMRIFYGSENIVSLRPQGPEDEDKAKLMEEKVNYDLQKGMNGFEILHDFFKDGLLQKKGVAKYRWEKRTEYKKKEYSGLNVVEFSALVEKENVEILEHSQDEQGFYSAKIRERIDISKPVIEVLASEEFMHIATERNLADAEFVAHKKKIKKAELKKYKVKDKKIEDEVTAFEEDPAYLERFNDLGGINFLTPDKESDDVWLYECYLNDYTDDGEKVRKKLTLVGNLVVDLEDNPYCKPPFCVCSPIRMPHRMVGRDIAELVLEIQKLRTALVRYILDNIYFQNNGMKVVNPFRINVDQLLNNNVPGGIATTLMDTNPGEAIYPVPIAPLPPHIMAIAEYVETMKENRTGITKYNQGLDSKSLNRTATGISQIMSAAQQRVEMIARVLAESEDGVKGIFSALVEMNLMFFDRKQNVKLNEKWVEIGPLDISGFYDIIIDIGGGTGSKEVKANQLMMMFDKYSVAAPVIPDMITKRNIFNMITAIWENLGFKNTSAFITAPVDESLQPPVGPQPEQQPQIGPQGAPLVPPGMPQGLPPEMMGAPMGPQMPPQMGPPMGGPMPPMGPPEGMIPPQMPPGMGMPMQPPMMPQGMPPMGGEVLSPFETMLMRQPPPMPPEPQTIVNMAPVTMNAPPVTVNNIMPSQEQAKNKILTPVYDEEGKITKVISETTNG